MIPEEHGEKLQKGSFHPAAQVDSTLTAFSRLQVLSSWPSHWHGSPALIKNDNQLPIRSPITAHTYLDFHFWISTSGVSWLQPSKGTYHEMSHSSFLPLFRGSGESFRRRQLQWYNGLTKAFISCKNPGLWEHRKTLRMLCQPLRPFLWERPAFRYINSATFLVNQTDNDKKSLSFQPCRVISINFIFHGSLRIWILPAWTQKWFSGALWLQRTQCFWHAEHNIWSINHILAESLWSIHF